MHTESCRVSTGCGALPENGLDLDSIHPRNGPQFSPNIYKFLKKKGRVLAGLYRVYRDSENILWIGSIDGDCFTGARLMDILRYGKREPAWSLILFVSSSNFTEIPNFWEDYMRIGRCAIDFGGT